MKNRLILLLLTLALGACSRGIKFDIDGLLVENAANRVYLVVEGTTLPAWRGGRAYNGLSMR